MSEIVQTLKTRLQTMVKRSPVADISEDSDVQEWLFFGRLAMFFCLWMAMLLPLILVITLRF